MVADFVYGAKGNVPDYVRSGGATYRVVSDQLGSPMRVVNVGSSSDVPFAASYTSFGEVTGTALDWMPFGFAGGVYDGDTGLVRFGARDYDPLVGRWTARDPVRFQGQQANLYVYVNDEPVNRRDPSGLGQVCNYSSQTVYVKDENSGALLPVLPGTCNDENDGVYNPEDRGFTDAPEGGLVRKFNNWTDIDIFDERPRSCNPNEPRSSTGRGIWWRSSSTQPAALHRATYGEGEAPIDSSATTLDRLDKRPT